MLRVAITGGIGTGKSYVLGRVAARGVPTIDSDAVVHDLLSPSTAVTTAIAERFGRSILLPGGAVDRKALGRLVFADAAARAALEQIVHPAVFARIDAWAEEHRQRGVRWVLADVPLLFETGREDDFDQVIVAACDAETQVRRVMARDGLSEADARARLAAQWPIERKVRRADYVVNTGGSFEETDRQIDEVVTKIQSGAR